MAGLSIGLVLMLVGERLGWGSGWDPVFFFAGWGIGLSGAAVAWVRARRSLAGLRLRCAYCDTVLLELRRVKDTLARADIVVATGACPSCGHEFIAQEA
jgi:hypothetical protein